jgi:REP element-mobilizing transposase RayT
MSMSMPRRIIPGGVYMVTRRCTQRQFLLRPDRETTNAFVYCLALAAQRTEMRVLAFLAHSNHHHTIVVDTHGRMPEFLENFHKLVAKHQNALRGRWENFWASEATSVVELVDPDDILAKMTYALTNPVKDGLIDRADQWPGASSMWASLNERPISARRPSRFFRKEGALPKSVTLEIERPPGLGHISPADWRTMLADRISSVESAARDERHVEGRSILGRAEVLKQRPTDRPPSREARRQLSPRVASVNKWGRIEAIQRNKAFLAAYRAARDLWKAGAAVLFPAGTYWLRRFASVLVEPPTDCSQATAAPT